MNECVMKRVIDTSEVLGSMELSEGNCELCATAEADYHDDTHQLIVHLDSLLRTTDLRTPERHPSAQWLPKPETICESVGLDESMDVARDIFHRWARKVRESAPSLHGVAT